MEKRKGKGKRESKKKRKNGKRMKRKGEIEKGEKWWKKEAGK